MQKPAIAILGGTGVYARHLIPRLTREGWRVRALVRRPEAAGIALACGAEVVPADIFDQQSMVNALAGCDIGINLATSLPGPSGRGDYATNDKLRAEGTGNWVQACKEAAVSRVLQQSIGMVNASGSAEWSDEDTIYGGSEETLATSAFAASLTMEKAIRSSGLDHVILRGGLFYGPGTGFDDNWHARAAAGKLRVPGTGEDYVSLVHVADMAVATVRALTVWPSGEALIICDDEPATWLEVFGYLAQLHGQSPPSTGGQAGFPSFRLRNDRVKARLGWAPFFPSWRVGLAR